MEFEFTWIDSSLVVCRSSGAASADGFAALLSELAAQPEFGLGVRVLADHSELDASGISAGDIERIAEVRAVSARGTGMRTALVAGSDSPARYGLARMFEAYVVSQDDGSIKVFEDFGEGMAWLRALDSPSPSGVPVEAEEAVADPAV
jgi:hypothetical protein